MSLRLAHLQVLWGAAGAREKFEDMVTQLIKVERPDSQRVRVVTGDGGLDSFVGGLTEQGGVDVYQVKYFPDGIGKSQKQQIRESFATVCNSTRFRAKSWTLCLPIDLSIDESRWFELWAKKQAGANIEIWRPWSAMHLESLLLKEKNRGIRHAFFRERDDRNLKLRINPIWSRNRLYAQLRLFNSGPGAVYIASWWTEWGPNNRRANNSVKTVKGRIPVRLDDQDATEFLVEIATDVESLCGIGVIDGDNRLWLADDGDLVVFKHNAIAHRLPVCSANADEASLAGIAVEVTALANRPAGTRNERLEVTFKNGSDRSVLLSDARLSWVYTPPRQMPILLGRPSVAETGGSVTLSPLSKVSSLGAGEEAVFVLDEDMSGVLVELTRGDVRDEAISIEFTAAGGLGWTASMDEIPSVVRSVANSVVERLSQMK